MSRSWVLNPFISKIWILNVDKYVMHRLWASIIGIFEPLIVCLITSTLNPFLGMAAMQQSNMEKSLFGKLKKWHCADYEKVSVSRVSRTGFSFLGFLAFSFLVSAFLLFCFLVSPSEAEWLSLKKAPNQNRGSTGAGNQKSARKGSGHASF